MSTLDSLQENDEYYTPKYIWEAILNYLDPTKIYLDPFYGNGGNIDNLNQLGINCVGGNIDCFEALHELNYDIILTNSPFSKPILTEFLYNLSALDKPFIIILPITKIFSKYFKQAFRQYRSIQIIIPKSRLKFIDATRPNNKSNPSFVCAYITYKLNLPSDILFL
jgi:hypothetical protein